MLIAVSLIVALAACSRPPDRSPDTRPAPKPAAAERADPMANFERFVRGQWRQTSASGQNMYHTWGWGPGRHSIRRATEGFGADGRPWRELQIFYWHPARRQVCVLVLSPFARGVSEGTVRFEGGRAEGAADLYQAGGVHRRMGLRWAFAGPDMYYDTLLEAGPRGLEPLVGFTHVRIDPIAVPRDPTIEREKPSGYLKAVVPLLGRAWEATGETATGGPAAGDAIDTRTTFEWIPLADAVHARVTAPTTDGEPMHMLDAYIYHHTGAAVLRCLVLSRSGGVYEGDVTALAGGGIQIDMKGYEADAEARYVVRVDYEKDGAVRERVWLANGAGRTLLRDVHRRQIDVKEK